MTFADGVKRKLKEIHMTQNELAKKAGLSSSGMSTIMTGKARPRVDSMQAIADALGCTISDLLGDPATVLSATGAAVPGLSPEEQILVENFRSLNASGQEALMSMLAGLLENPAFARQATYAG